MREVKDKRKDPIHEEIHRLLSILYGLKKNKAKNSVGIKVRVTRSQFIADWCKICKGEI